MAFPDNPPSYEATNSSVFTGSGAIANAAKPKPASGDKKTAHIDDAQRKESTPLAPQMTPSAYYSTAGPSYVPHPAAGSAAPTVYNYYSPLTQQHVASLLPPDHPEMICLQAGEHVTQSRFGILGMLAAVFWFPLGVGLCMLDRRVSCQRCGAVLSDSCY